MQPNLVMVQQPHQERLRRHRESVRMKLQSPPVDLELLQSRGVGSRSREGVNAIREHLSIFIDERADLEPHGGYGGWRRRDEEEEASEALRKEVEGEDQTTPSLERPTHQAIVVRPKTDTDKQREMVTDVSPILTCRVWTGGAGAPRSRDP